MKLKHKASLAILAFSFFFLALLAGGFIIFSQHDARKAASENLRILAGEISSHLGGHIQEHISVAVTLSHMPLIEADLLRSNAEFSRLSEEERRREIAQLDSRWIDTDNLRDAFILGRTDNPVARHLKRQMQLFPGIYGEIFLTNRYGLALAATGKLTTLAHARKQWWATAFDEGRGRIFLDDRGYDASAGGYVLGIVVPVMHNGELSGILKSNINIQGAISELIDNFNRDHNMEAKLVRSRGQIIYEQGSLPLSSEISSELGSCIAGQTLSSTMVAADKTYLAGCAPVDFALRTGAYAFDGTARSMERQEGDRDEEWSIVLLQDADMATAHNQEVTRAILVTGLLIALFASLLAWLLGSVVARPIERLAGVAKQIGEGDLEARTVETARDEIGLLAASINRMAADLKATVATRDEVQQEIERRKQAEKRLIFLSSSVEQAKEAVSITNRDGVIEYINPAFTELTGYSEPEATGKFQSILKSGKQSKRFYENLWERIRGGEAWTGRIENRKKDGSLYPAMMTISPIVDEAGEISHFVSTQQSLKEYEELEEHLRQSQKMEAVGVLVGGIAHDFNNMLAGIIGNLYLAKRKAETPYMVNKLENIESLSFRASGMIRRLLTFARKDIVEMKPFELTSFVKETSKLNRTTIPENIAFHMEISKKELMVNGDPTQLQQVIINLLSNACDAVATVEGPAINLRLAEFMADGSFAAAHPELEGDCFAHLVIEDNGSGIPDENKAHIFEPFFTTKDVGSGSGLGLAMVYGAVKSHGGAIDIDNTPERGVAFHIYLPTIHEKRASSYRSDLEQIQPGHGETILVVDDDEVVRLATKEVLESIGYRVLEAVDGVDAIHRFEQERESIALIITDIVMPRLGGIMAIQRIKEIEPGIRVIFSTGYNKDELQADISASEHPMLSKPFVIEELSQVVRQQLDGSALS